MLRAFVRSPGVESPGADEGTSSMARRPALGLMAATAASGLLVAGLALHATAAAPESAAPDRAPADIERVEKVTPELMEAMTRDLGLTRAEAGERLSFQAEASGIAQRLEGDLGRHYAGSWLGEDANRMYVAVTTADAKADVVAEGATAVVVDHSLDALDGWLAELDAAAESAGDAVPTRYVDVESNRIVVGAHDIAKARKLVRDAGVPASAVEITKTSERPEPLIDVVGGNAYYIGSGSRCSIGFSVQGGFVTAGHCGRTGARTSQPTGTFRGSSFPGNDYAWVEVASGNTPIGAVNNYSGGRVEVAGSTDAPIGAAVCRSGSTTGWHCGSIQARNATVTYPEGTVSGLIRTNVCAEPGDSGGSLLAGDQAQGVTSGGSGNCSRGGTTYFQPVNEILQAYRLDLITSDGGGDPEPPPTGCSDYPNVYQRYLSSGGQSIEPNGGYFYRSVSGTHEGCLDGPSGADFDLYLQKWTGWSWSTVARSISPGPSETVTYNGTPGYYRYVVHAYSGSGSYTVGISAP